MSVIVRHERDDDAARIRAVNEAAFAQRAEADLVDRLRADGALLMALVAEDDGDLVGYAGFPELTVASPQGRHPAAALAPVAVMPSRQKQGVGTALIERGLDMLKRQGESLVFVLGDPAYYRRFGFDADAAAVFTSPYNGPHLQLLRLAQVGPASGSLYYPPAFESLG